MNRTEAHDDDWKNGQPLRLHVLISIQRASSKILIGKEEGKAGSVFRLLNTSHSSDVGGIEAVADAQGKDHNSTIWEGGVSVRHKPKKNK